MRTVIACLVPCAALLAGIADAAEPAAPSAKSSQATPERVLVDAARKIARQATAADVQRATAALGPAGMVQHRRCQAGSGKCAEAPEAQATERIEAWMKSSGTADVALLVTSCRTEAGWKVGRVTVRSQPRGKKNAPGAPPPAPLHEDIDAGFLRATCAK